MKDSTHTARTADVTRAEPATHTDVVVEQFDAGAPHFDVWAVTHDERMLHGLAEFCGLGPDDDVLDVACGTGAFALYAAGLARRVTGVDVSAGMIAVARGTAAARGLANAEFRCCDVERLDAPDARYTVVASRSAFHHMPHCDRVFAQMVRCCRPGGTVAVQDVMAYDDPAVDAFAERLETLIDRSHHRTRTRREFFDLFKERGVALDALFDSETLLDVEHYAGHVGAPGADDRTALRELLAEGAADPRIAAWFEERDGRLMWRRRVCTIKGRTSRRPGGIPDGKAER